MSFLQPLLLLAMPLIGLPVLIHLLNQRRHKTAEWAARDFVLQASNMRHGMASVRHWLVLALRTLAIAALIFAISRPLASRIPGLGFLGGQRTQIILMDRSPSMAMRDSDSGLTWRDAGLNQLQQHLQTIGGKRLLFHSLESGPVAVGTNGLAQMLETSVTGTQSNLPELVERSLDHIHTQAVGPSDIWVVTDRQSSDWRLESERWSRIRQQLEALPEVKLHFLTPEPSNAFNLAVSAENIKLVHERNKTFLYLDFSVRQISGQIQQRKIPVHIQVAGGGERNIDIEMVASDFKHKQFRIEVSPELTQGCGVIRLPLDSNESDNQFYFSYASRPPEKSVIVSDNQEIADLLQLVCRTPFDHPEDFDCQVLASSSQAEIDWENTALIVWHAALPSGTAAERLIQFVSGGGNVVFLPVDSIGSQEGLFDVRWGDWEGKRVELPVGKKTRAKPAAISAPAETQTNFQVAQWRTEDDLLATDHSGRELPLRSIRCSRRCFIESDSGSMLASFEDGRPLLVRAATESGGAYFLGATPDEANSNFTDDGVALYVMFQRALEQGSVALARNKQLETGASIENTHLWKPFEINGSHVAEDQRSYFAGAYHAGDQVVAINRPASEDNATAIDETSVKELLGEDAFDIIETSATSLAGLTNEIWKLFIIAMVIALIVEGWFSLPAKRQPTVELEAVA